MGIFAARPHLLAVLATLTMLLGAPPRAPADMRPLTREMLENLRAVNAVGESLAVDDFATIEDAARDLEDRARRLQTWDMADIGLDSAAKAEFGLYLGRQERAADGIMRAARHRDGPGVAVALGKLMRESCLGCHREFRDRRGMLKPSTLFMTSFLASWKEINRGLLLNDFSLIGRAARTLSTMGHVLSWDPVIQSSFEIAEASRRIEFRQHLYQLVGAADRIEQGATRGEAETVEKALGEMWDKGCLACHKAFR